MKAFVESIICALIVIAVFGITQWLGLRFGPMLDGVCEDRTAAVADACRSLHGYPAYYQLTALGGAIIALVAGYYLGRAVHEDED